MLNSGYNSGAVGTAILLQTNAANIPDECFIWLTLNKGIGAQPSSCWALTHIRQSCNQLRTVRQFNASPETKQRD